MEIAKRSSLFIENVLSAEEIIKRGIDSEITTSLIKSKFGKKFDLTEYVKALMKKDDELKKLLDDERKKMNTNKLLG